MLIEQGADPHERNIDGWSPIDIACRQRWPQDLLVKSFGATVALSCNLPLERPRREFKYSGPGGDWFKQHGDQAQSMCDVDVRDSIKPEEFIRDYVAVRRPVLMRKALRGKSWDALRTRWSRGNVAKAHTDVRFNTSTIPYAKQFDESAHEEEMDLVQYIEYMTELERASAASVRCLFVLTRVCTR
jgi:hypothetical protein